MRIDFLIFIFGLISGFLLLTTGNTLNFWLAKEGLNVTTIALFSLTTLPYAINFLWSPFLDTVKIANYSKFKFKSNRLNWIILLHILISFLFLILGSTSIQLNIKFIALLATLISFLSATQDSVLNALRAEILAKYNNKVNSGFYILGYRIGMILSGSLAIYISTSISWQNIYKIFALVTLIFSFVLIYFLKSHEDPLNDNYSTDLNTKSTNQSLFKINLKSYIKQVLEPIGDFRYIILLMLFLICYRLPDNFIMVVLNKFLLEKNYSEQDIAISGKFCGIIGSMIGGLIAGHYLKTFNIIRCLFIFGLIHTFAHLSYIIIDINQKNIYILLFSTIVESFTGGMTMAAYIHFITSLCKGKFKATQYSLMSSMMGVSRSIPPSIAGLVAANLNWHYFFLFSSILSFPALLLLSLLKSNIKVK